MNLLPLLTVTLILGCAISSHADTTDGRFERTIQRNVSLGYRTVTPVKFDPQQKYPLLLFLHGRGEQGDDLDKVQIHGPFKKVAELGLPLIIVAPQSPLDEWWQADELSALTDHLLETLPIDRSRVYLTGLSMGGQGTWRLAMHRPELFAAIAPICGFGRPNDAAKLKHVPTWIFHGGRDDVINYRESTTMADALYRVGNNARLTIYPDAGHDSWTETYNDPKFYEWLLSHRKPAS